MTRRGWFIVVVIALLAAGGAVSAWLLRTTPEPAPVPDGVRAFRTHPADERAETTASRGPVTATLTAAPRAAAVGTPVVLSLDVRAPEGITIDWPELAGRHGLLLVRMTHAFPSLPIDDVTHWRREWELTTFGAGTIEIPGVEVAFRDDRAADAPVDGVLVLDALTVTRGTADVASETPGEPEVTDVVDVPIPFEWGRLRLPAVILGGTALLLALLLWLRQRPRRERVVPPRPPAEIALEALAALRDADLLARGAYERFYDDLSAIVRAYVEGRFDIHAPERTTEEFLRAARQERDIDPHDRDALGAFLRAADLVKFARVTPSPDEGTDALDLAEAFVHRTRRVITREGAE